MEKGVRVWRAIGASVTGTQHQQNGTKNQDGIHIRPWITAKPIWEGTNQHLILSVADGHGDSLCFRSRFGAWIAIWSAEQVFRSILISLQDEPSLLLVKREVEESLPKDIVRRWRKRVEKLLQLHPLLSSDFEKLDKQLGTAKTQRLRENHLLAYGTTIISVLVTNQFIVFVQLGDGDIITVSDDCFVSRPLLPDDRLFANATTSICQLDAWNNFRVRFQVVSADIPPPSMILVSTDGYSNSFPDEVEFQKVGQDLYHILKTNGISAGWQIIQNNIMTWLSEISCKGSGDDVTQGIILRSDAFTDTLER